MLLQSAQMIWVHPPNQVSALMFKPLGVMFVDDMLGKVTRLLVAADLVIVADAATPGGDVDRPLIVTLAVIWAIVWGELNDLQGEVTSGNLDPRVPVMYDFVLWPQCPSTAHSDSCGARTERKSQRRVMAREREGAYS